MRIKTLYLCFFFLSNAALGQKKLTERLLSVNGDSTKKSSFIVLPAVGYAQETGWNFGIVSLSSFYTDREDTLTRNSTIAALAAITTKKQTNFAIKPDVWSPGNRYHYTGDLKYRNFPFNFYGIGDKTREADKDIITQKLIRVAGEAEKLIQKRWYLGLTASYENYVYSDKEAGGIYETSPAIRDREGGQVAFIGFSQIIDSRNTNTYTTRGTYIKFNYSFAPDFFGGQNYSGSLFKLDFRTFNSLSRKTVLGINLNYQTLQGSNAPFYLLPQLGSDQMMRGYYTGRYRDLNLLAAQTELRYRPISRIALTAFLGGGSAYGLNGFAFDRIKPSYGGGLRYFIDPARGTTLRLDYGFGEKRAGEKRQKGFYLSFNEAF